MSAYFSSNSATHCRMIDLAPIRLSLVLPTTKISKPNPKLQDTELVTRHRQEIQQFLTSHSVLRCKQQAEK